MCKSLEDTIQESDKSLWIVFMIFVMFCEEINIFNCTVHSGTLFANLAVTNGMHKIF